MAPTAEVEQTRALVAELVGELVRHGATFVVPVDAEKLRPGDDMPICFDWLVWRTLHANLGRRPADAPSPLAIAVQHHKTEEQIPPEFEELWDDLRASKHVQIENVSHWNMNSKRMEAQARWGDILIGVGGSDGVLYLANLYHDAGKPVVPLNAGVSPADGGARRLFSDIGLSSTHAPRPLPGGGPECACLDQSHQLHGTQAGQRTRGGHHRTARGARKADSLRRAAPEPQA